MTMLNGIPALGYFREKSTRLTKEEYNYLLPVLRGKVYARRDVEPEEYYFISRNDDEITDMRERLKGLYW